MSQEGKYIYNWPRASLTADIVVFRLYNPIQILFIERKNPPLGLALPGGFMNIDEKLIDTAKRELKEETNLDVEINKLNFVGLYDKVERDDRGRTISVAYMTIIRDITKCKALDDARNLCFVDIDKIPQLAFDHNQIVDDAISQFLIKNPL